MTEDVVGRTGGGDGKVELLVARVAVEVAKGGAVCDEKVGA